MGGFQDQGYLLGIPIVRITVYKSLSGSTALGNNHVCRVKDIHHFAK